MTPTQPIRILLVDDHRMVRHGLRSLLESEEGFEVVAEAADGRTAVKLAAESSPAVVVMDIRMPDLNGIEATRRLLAAHPRLKVIALSAHTDEQTAAEMLRAGASAYLPKESAFDELVQAVRAVAADRVYLSARVAGALVRESLAAPREAAAGAATAYTTLSSREREVLQLLAEGKATKEAAMVLGLSVKTVETHRRQIMEKLNLHSVAELTKYAIREGLTSAEM